MNELGPENAIWDDGEWVSWENINSHLARLEFLDRFPHGNPELSPALRDLISAASGYHMQTGKHLQLHGAIGELFGAVYFGVTLHKPFAQGSDGRLGNDFVEIKTISPLKGKDIVTVKRAGNFNRLLVVKIDEDYEVSGRMVDRADIEKGSGKLMRIKWSDIGSRT